MIDLEYWRASVKTRQDVADKSNDWSGLVINGVCRYWYLAHVELMRLQDIPQSEIDAWLLEMEKITIEEIDARTRRMESHDRI